MNGRRRIVVIVDIVVLVRWEFMSTGGRDSQPDRVYVLPGLPDGAAVSGGLGCTEDVSCPPINGEWFLNPNWTERL